MSCDKYSLETYQKAFRQQREKILTAADVMQANANNGENTANGNRMKGRL